MKKLVLILIFALVQISYSQWEQSDLIDIRVERIIQKDNYMFAIPYDGGIYRSVDSGKTWVLVENDITWSRFTDLAVLEGNIFAASDGSYGNGGIYCSPNNGANWFQMNTGLNHQHVWALKDHGENLFAGTSRGGVYISKDKGLTWGQVNNGLTLPLDSWGVLELGTQDNNIFMGGQGIGVWRSISDGEEWKTVRDYELFSSAGFWNTSSIASSGSYLYVAFHEDGIIRSTDSGDNWMKADTGLPVKDYGTVKQVKMNCIVATGNTVYVATNDNGVYISKDNAENWEPFNEGLYPRDINTLCLTDKYIYAGTFNNGIWRRHLKYSELKVPILFNLGEDGNPVSQTPTFTWNNTGADAYQLQVAASSTGIIYKDNDKLLADDFDNPILDVENIKDTFYISPKTLEIGKKYVWRVRGLYGSEYSGWSNILSFVPGEINSVLDVINIANITAYPNPFSQSTVICYQLKINSYVSLKLFDIFGNKITTLVDEWQEAGEHSAVFDVWKTHACFLPSGIYYMQLRAGNEIETNQIVFTN